LARRGQPVQAGSNWAEVAGVRSLSNSHALAAKAVGSLLKRVAADVHEVLPFAKSAADTRNGISAPKTIENWPAFAQRYKQI